MALASFTRISWWRLWGTTAPKLDGHSGTATDTNTTTTGATNNLSSSFDFGLGFREPETTNFRLSSRHSTASSSTARKSRRKWQSREERRTRFHDEDDVVMVPSDGACCLSGSESEDSDWSIGWLEPYAPEFLSDAEDGDASFAVIVPCYGRGRGGMGTGNSAPADHTSSPAYYNNNNNNNRSTTHHRNFFPAIDLTNSSETRKYMEDLLSALQSST